MTRLEAFAERVTREMLLAGEACEHCDIGKRWEECTCAKKEAAARSVLEREVRALAREIDCDTQGPAQSYLDEPVTK